MFSGGYLIYMIIGGVFTLIGGVVQRRLKSTFEKYSKAPITSGKSGAEVARDMLAYYGVNDVQVTQGQGYLSDHYNPKKKTINLSPTVYAGKSIASAAVAAHECGHAVQHATSYRWLEFRSTVVPAVSFASRAQQFLLILALGGIGAGAAAGSWLLMITILAFGITTAFAVITLPVEFDASKRALAWLDDTGILSPTEHEGAATSLKWAAMTYVVAALSSLVMLLWLILRYVGR